jgi:hypothetical protein
LVVAVLAFIALAFVLAQVTTALTHLFASRHRQEPLALRDAINRVASHSTDHLSWAVIGAPTALALGHGERRGLIEPAASSHLGLSWRAAIWMTVPVMALEGTGPTASLRRAQELVRGSAAEVVRARATIVVAWLAAAAPTALAMWVAHGDLPTLAWAAVGTWLALASGVVLALSAGARVELYQRITTS